MTNFIKSIKNLKDKIIKTNIKTSAAAVSAGIIISIAFLLLFSKNPARAAIDFVTGTATSRYYLGSFLNTAVLLIVAGLGASIAVKGGNLNLGGEGQIYAGGFFAAIILTLPLPSSAAIIIPAAVSAACAAGAFQAVLSALLRKFKKANVLLTSFLISAAVIPCIDSLIAGKFRDKTGNLLATQFIPENLRFAQLLKPSPLNISIFAAPLLCLIFHYFIYRTDAGRRLRIWGIAPEFARYCGYSEEKSMFLSLAASGAMHGLAGAIAVCGTYFTCHSGFYTGMGWNALSCALIAQSEPLLLIPASLILSWLYTSSGRVALMQEIQFDISSLIQGIILFCISFNYVARSRRT
ncbi:ABC transporter permease [Treponema parvum]|uniref:ABC transporter permease n=1 Tax=Treponema parvum TaxID=138851 RepID=A0A975IDJ0_9SPIR|nr:ABC transporter permease [Treponema parvum]QTQ12224.1 ABC transporter permease [Treponema parvum]